MRAVLWSGGADSTLVLKRELEKNPDVGIIQFRTDWTREQKRWVDNFIVENDLTVHTWLPRQRYLINLDGQPRLVDEYAYGNTFIPTVRDILPSEKGMETLEMRLTPTYYPLWDELLTGWLHTDKYASKGCKLGSIKVWSPIWEMTKDEVLKELGDYPTITDETDTGNIFFNFPEIPESNLAYYYSRLAEQGYEKLHEHDLS